MRHSNFTFLMALIMLLLSACQPIIVQSLETAAPQPVASEDEETEADFSKRLTKFEATVEGKVQNAMSAAPPAIAQEATIMDWPEGWPGNWPDEPAGELVELRPGSNGWTCFPARPDTPTNDPQCLNQDMLAWRQAILDKTEPEVNGVGIAYMLQGGSSASKSDPFLLEPPAGQEWGIGPAHLMVYVPGGEDHLTAFSTQPGPIPWLMNEGTPYAHLMITIPPLATE